MERNLSSYLRQILALCFVLAGLLTLAEQAHCLTMTQISAASQAMAHAPASHHDMISDDGDCPHKDGCKGHRDLTFLQQPNGTIPHPHLASPHVHPAQALLTPAQATAIATGNKQSPPASVDRGALPSALTITGRLLI